MKLLFFTLLVNGLLFELSFGSGCYKHYGFKILRNVFDVLGENTVVSPTQVKKGVSYFYASSPTNVQLNSFFEFGGNYFSSSHDTVGETLSFMFWNTRYSVKTVYLNYIRLIDDDPEPANFYNINSLLAEINILLARMENSTPLTLGMLDRNKIAISVTQHVFDSVIFSSFERLVRQFNTNKHKKVFTNMISSTVVVQTKELMDMLIIQWQYATRYSLFLVKSTKENMSDIDSVLRNLNSCFTDMSNSLTKRVTLTLPFLQIGTVIDATNILDRMGIQFNSDISSFTRSIGKVNDVFQVIQSTSMLFAGDNVEAQDRSVEEIEFNKPFAFMIVDTTLASTDPDYIILDGVYVEPEPVFIHPRSGKTPKDNLVPGDDNFESPLSSIKESIDGISVAIRDIQLTVTSLSDDS